MDRQHALVRAGYPPEAQPLADSSGLIASDVAAATLETAAEQTAFLSGFSVTAAGATAGLPVEVTVTGVVGGPLSFVFAAPAGALVSATPLRETFDPPLAAVAGQNIVVSCPDLGNGNTHAAVNAWGFRI